MNLLDLAVKISVEDEASKQVGQTAAKIKKVLGTAAKAGAAAVGALSAATIGAGGALVAATGQVAEYGDNIDKMSQKMGMSREAYQEWDAVMQHSGTSMEAMKSSMKTLANAAETGSEAFDRLGISQEEIASMSQEELFEATITALQNVEDETERTYLAGKTLGKGATELGALLNTSAEDTQAMRDRVHELGGVMSDEAVMAAAAYQDSLQDMNTAISGMKNNLVSEFIPGVKTIMDGLTEIIVGNADEGTELITSGVYDMLDRFAETAPKVIETASAVFSGLVTAAAAWIGDNWESIAAKGSEFIGQFLLGLATKRMELAAFVSTLIADLAAWIGDNWQDIVAKGAGAIEAIIEGITTTSGELVTMMGEMIPSIASWIGENWEGIVEKGSEVIGSIITGISEAAGGLISIVSELIPSIATWIGDNWDGIVAKGSEIISSIITGITQTAGELMNYATDILPSVAGWIGDNFGDIVSKGSEIIGSILTGITDTAGNLMEFVTNIIPSVVTWIGTNFAEIVSKGSEIIQSLIDGATDKNDNELSPMFENLPSQLGEKLGDLTTTLFTYGLTFIQGFYDGVNQLLSGELGNAFINLAGNLGNLIGDVANALVSAGFDFLYGFFTGSTNATNESGQPFFTTLLDTLLSWIKAVGSVASFLTKTGIEFINGFLNGVTGGKWTEITDFFADIPSKAKGFIGDVSKSLEQKGKDIINGLKGGIDNIWETAKTFFTGLGDTIVGLVPNPIEMLYSVGSDVVQGFINGINTFDVNGLIDTIFGPFAPNVKELLGIASPSTVFEEIGDYTMQGLENGISGGESAVDDALGGIANGLPDNFADAYWAMHDMGAGLATSFGTGMNNTFLSSVIPTISGMNTAIQNAVGGYYTLWDAGQNIMSGLGDSMVSYFYNSVAYQLRSITNMIPSFKGPLDKDKNLLVDNGEAIMQGLMKGIGNGADELYDMLGNITTGIPSNVSYGADGIARASGGITVVMERAFEGASMSFRNRQDMEEFSQIMAETIAETTAGRFAVA